MKHLIARVDPGSIAAELEIEAGDFVLAVNGQDIEDGPAAYGIHSVEEHLNVASVGRVYRLLRAFLVKCKPE